MKKLLFLFLMLTTASIMWANEVTPMPEISYYDTGESVVVTATGYGHICLYWDDMLMAEGEDGALWEIPYGEDPEGEEFGIAATAQEEGKEVSDYALATIYVPGKQQYQTPPPEIYAELTDDALVLYAYGEGIVTLYIQFIDNFTGNMTTESFTDENEVIFSIERAEEDTYINFWATAQADENAYLGTTNTEYYFLIPAKENSEPDPHYIDNWVVFIDRNGEENWFELYKGSDGSYTATLALDYATYGGYRPGIDPVRQVPLYFMIDGMRYGAADDNTEVVIGNLMANPLSESDGNYTLPVGYNYTVGVYFDWENGFLVYAAKGSRLPGDPSEYADDDTLRGDADGDGAVSIADIVLIVDYLLNPNSTEINLVGADADLDGAVSIADIVAIVDYMLAATW